MRDSTSSEDSALAPSKPPGAPAGTGKPGPDGMRPARCRRGRACPPARYASPSSSRSFSYAGSVRKSTKSSARATCSKSSRESVGPALRDRTTRRRRSPRGSARAPPSPARRTRSAVTGRPSSSFDAVAHPLPHLRAGDLGRGRVLHQPVDRRPRRCRAATTRCTGCRRCTFAAQALLGDLARRRGDVERARPAETETSSRCRSTWFGRSPSTASNSAVATGTESGCATHVPSKPSPASRRLSAPTRSTAPAAFASGPCGSG